MISHEEKLSHCTSSLFEQAQSLSTVPRNSGTVPASSTACSGSIVRPGLRSTSDTSVRWPAGKDSVCAEHRPIHAHGQSRLTLITRGVIMPRDQILQMF